MDREYFDIIVFIPLEEELREFQKYFPYKDDKCTDTIFRYRVDSDDSEINILVVHQEDMGRVYASEAVAGTLKEYNAGLIVCLGIAGALSNDVKLGDVCYSGNITDVYNNAKMEDGEKGDIKIEFSPTNYRTPTNITANFNFIRLIPDLRKIYETWQIEREEFAKTLVPNTYNGRNGIEETFGLPKTVNGSIVCGNVTKSKSYREKLLGIDRKMLAIETESGGVFDQASRNSIPAITIRGISDYADEGKGELEAQLKGAARTIAASNAASFLKLQLQNEYFLKTLKKIRAVQLGPTLPNIDDIPTSTSNLSDVIDELELEINGKLRELSPEFRLQPEGYRLPTPRIQRVNSESSIERNEPDPVPIEIRDALIDHQIFLINIPRTYPDQSLAWVIAHDLLTAEIDKKQAVPFIVDGMSMRPPKHGLDKIASNSISTLYKVPAAQVVIIVNKIPFDSKSRLNYLLNEIKRYPKAKFVLLTRDDANIVTESDLIQTLSASEYDICDVSFVEIFHFIQKNFSMSGSEAEVVALRLHDTFNQFNLSAHPTYFAGIPRETLSALLQANRRTELIQLAVDGFLTFVVADDKAKVTLSRTTRSNFLRKLANSMKVEKESFDHEKIIILVKSFADEFDFDIDPIEFIQSFVNKGILHFEGGEVRITLPFIESYLLSLELISNQDDANIYFQFEEPWFDLEAFDIYAELGANKLLVDQLIGTIERHIKSLSEKSKDPHILLSKELTPRMSGTSSRLSAIRKQLQEATDNVRNDSSDPDNKQRLLDMATRIRKATSKRSGGVAKDSDKGKEAAEQLARTTQVWAIGTVLLGSGAEHLNAETKRKLATLLIKLCSLITDEWTRVRAATDLEAVKSDLEKDETLKALGIDTDSVKQVKEAKKQIASLVDILDQAYLSQPFRALINHLCEQARHRVLEKSIKNAGSEGKIEDIIHGAWLADIGGENATVSLRKAIRALPVAPFLRITLATHFLTRVYWSHWQKKARTDLLEAAEEALKPLNVNLRKSELARLIKKDGKQTS